jgi:hypothetical protein
MAIKTQNTEIHSLVQDIKDKRLLLPELQRSYIWKSTQVRDLFDSLYRQYPSGQLLVWQTEDLAYARAASIELTRKDTLNAPFPSLLLDGQQRLTSLSAILNDTDLIVRDSKRSIDIVFNVYRERFEVAGPKNQNAKDWVSLRKLYSQGVLSVLADLEVDSRSETAKDIYVRLQKLDNIRQYRYNVNVLEQMSYDEVTHIFVRINSGGTKLSTADLALAQLSSRWRGITEEIDKYYRDIKKLTASGLELETGILVRALSIILSGRTRLSDLFRGERQTLSEDEIKTAWGRVKSGIRAAINFLRNNCRIDRLDLLPTQYVLITLMAYFDKFKATDPMELRELQRWVYLALIWTRYSGTTETNVDQDVSALNANEPVSQLIQNLEDVIGRGRTVVERDLRGQLKNKKSPSMLLMYVLARYADAEDWFDGIQISASDGLEVHHIFPKDVLRERYDLKADRALTDQIANLAFLSKKANSQIRNKPPLDYLSSIATKRLSNQLVPLDKALWSLDRYEDFLQVRRLAIADGINQLISSLSKTPSIHSPSLIEALEKRIDLIEHQMREVVTERLTESRGDYALDLIPNDIRKTLKKRAEDLVQRNPSLAGEYEVLSKILNLAQFSDYPKIVKANWELFRADFGDEVRFEQAFRSVVVARNAIKHNNELSRADRATAEAGLIWIEDCVKTALVSSPDDEEDLDEE